MKLRGDVIEVRNCGDFIEVTMQAKVGRSQWKPIEKQTFRVDDNVSNRRAFYIGRVVRVSIVPL